MTIGQGFSDPSDSSSEFNSIAFIVRQVLATVRGSTLVQVKAVYDIAGAPVASTGLLAPVGLLDVQPMVNLIDGQGNPTAHQIICNVPYSRVQGGQNAIICDPQVGDIGVAVFADQDISTVKQNKAVSNPGSWRRSDWADGMYLFGILNGTPNQYVQFTATGINIVDMNGNIISMNPAGVDVTAARLTCTGAIIAGFGGSDQVGVQTHRHSQGNDNHGDTEVETNAPTAET